MAVPVKVPDIGTTQDEVILRAWLVEPGDTIKRGDIIAEMETDKAIVDFECPLEGTVLALIAQPEDYVKTGDVLMWLGAPGEAVPEGEPTGAAPAAKAEPRAEKAAPQAAAVVAPARERKTSIAIEARDITDPAFLLALYRKMLLIRQFEERVKFLFLEGVMPGTIHQYQGEEAVAVGVCSALQADDVITSTHRPHGHALARGLTVESLMHELFGKATGCCKGKGGSMHVGDLVKGMVPAIAIVGGGVPIATGVGLAFKMKQEPRVAVCFMGDGAVNEGAFHEGVNIGAIWSLPVVYVIENNLYSASTPICTTALVDYLADRACAYGIPGLTVDGNDVIEVHKAAAAALDRARTGEGPTILECMTYRITGHSRRDPCHYQPEEERRIAMEREPLKRFSAQLLAGGAADQAALDEIRVEVDAEIEAAVESAMAAPDPAPEDALEGLWV